MYTVLLVAHTFVVLFLIGVILLQRPEGDGLGGLGGGGGNLLSGRAAGNVLTRTTAILATLFILLSLSLAIINGHQSSGSIMDRIAAQPAEPAPAKADKEAPPAKATSQEPLEPQEPSVPKPD